MALIKHSERTIRSGCKSCGRKDLYWAHDTDREGEGFTCERHSSSGKMTLIEPDGSRHDCRNRETHSPSPSPESTWSSVTYPITPVSSPAPVSTAPNGAVPAGADKLATAAALLEALTPKVDAETVRELINAQHDAFAQSLLDKVDVKISTITAPVELHVTQPERETVVIKDAHNILPTVVKIVGQARKHLLMVGPAGTGKSKLASQIAEALSLPFREISLSPAMSPTALLGYMQAEGKYVTTAFRQVYEHGGVFHFDEMDNAHPSILAVINAALANGHCEFPDGRITKHPDTRIVASANTYGRGPDRVYVGRQALDGSTLDRFVVVPVDYDTALEDKLCLATGLDGNKVARAVGYVRAIRANAEAHKMPLIFSIRGSEALCALLAIGITPAEAIEYTIRKGISDGDWSKVTAGVTLPNL